MLSPGWHSCNYHPPGDDLISHTTNSITFGELAFAFIHAVAQEGPNTPTGRAGGPLTGRLHSYTQLQRRDASCRAQLAPWWPEAGAPDDSSDESSRASPLPPDRLPKLPAAAKSVEASLLPLSPLLPLLRTPLMLLALLPLVLMRPLLLLLGPCVRGGAREAPAVMRVVMMPSWPW